MFAAIAGAMRDIRAVPKLRTNEFHRYQFRGIDDFLDMVHPVLARWGLVMLPNIEGEPKIVERRTAKGAVELHCVVKVRWTIVAEDGSNVSLTTLGEASDTGDKGCNKAMSASQKYAISQAFAVPLNEPDRDTEERSPEFRGDAKAPPAPTTAKILDEAKQVATTAAAGDWFAEASAAKTMPDLAPLLAGIAGDEKKRSHYYAQKERILGVPRGAHA